MTVKEFAEWHGLEPNNEDGGGWLTMQALSDQSVGALAAITRIGEEQIMAIHAPLPSTSKRAHICYCARCVFLNPSDVTAPIWRWEWLDETLSACSVHDEGFTSLPSGRVLACGNLTHLMQLVSRHERELRYGFCRRPASVVR
jgi:hypothetical protein